MKTKILLFLFVLLNQVLFSQNLWEKLNGPPGGLMVRILAFGDTIIATGENFKIFLSTNRGENWKQFQFPIPENADILRIMGLEILEDYIYASTWYHGIYRSRDLIIWEKLNYSTTCETISKDYSGNIYAGSQDGKLYRSSDEGQSWLLEFSDEKRYPFWKVLVSGDSSVWAGTRDKLIRKKVNSLVWEETDFPGFYDILDIVEDDSQYIYITNSSYIKRSIDDGLTWEDMDPNGFLINNYMRNFVFNSRIIGAFRDDTGLFGNGWGAAVSDDRGVTWRWAQTGLPPKITSSRITAGGTDTYIATWGAGVYKSSDFGDNWFPRNNGINAAITRKLSIDSDGNIYTASWASGVSRSTDGGKSWIMINNGFNNVNFYSIISDQKGNLMAGSENGVYRSTDKGENWVRTNSVGNNFGYDFKVDRFSRIYCHTYGSGLYRTTDLGQNWERLDKNFISQYTFGFDTDKNDNIYVGTRGGAIYKSTDDCNTWSKVYQSTVSNTAISEIITAPNGNIFATCIKEGVLRSQDSGITWQVVKQESGVVLFNYPLAITKTGDIFTTDSKNKIFKSEDNGNNWIDITSNLGKVRIRSFTVDNEDNLYLATEESVWKSNPDSLTGIAEDDIKPKEYFLSQNYPNPFNPSTTIKYSLPQTGRVTLSIYDLLGREVVKLIDEEKPAGEYETKWSASSYPTGVYFLKMQAGQFSEMRKLLLMK
jgi:photosystem II stability/assembly factor-like uncharacterized protein